MLDELYIVDKYRSFYLALFKNDFFMCYRLLKSLSDRLKREVELNPETKEVMLKLDKMEDEDLDLFNLTLIAKQHNNLLYFPDVHMKDKDGNRITIKSNKVVNRLSEYIDNMLYLLDQITIELKEEGITLGSLGFKPPSDLWDITKDTIE